MFAEDAAAYESRAAAGNRQRERRLRVARSARAGDGVRRRSARRLSGGVGADPSDRHRQCLRPYLLPASELDVRGVGKKRHARQTALNDRNLSMTAIAFPAAASL